MKLRSSKEIKTTPEASSRKRGRQPNNEESKATPEASSRKRGRPPKNKKAKVNICSNASTTETRRSQRGKIISDSVSIQVNSNDKREEVPLQSCSTDGTTSGEIGTPAIPNAAEEKVKTVFVPVFCLPVFVSCKAEATTQPPPVLWNVAKSEPFDVKKLCGRISESVEKEPVLREYYFFKELKKVLQTVNGLPPPQCPESILNKIPDDVSTNPYGTSRKNLRDFWKEPTGKMAQNYAVNHFKDDNEVEIINLEEEEDECIVDPVPEMFRSLGEKPEYYEYLFFEDLKRSLEFVYGRPWCSEVHSSNTKADYDKSYFKVEDVDTIKLESCMDPVPKIPVTLNDDCTDSPSAAASRNSNDNSGKFPVIIDARTITRDEFLRDAQD